MSQKSNKSDIQNLRPSEFMRARRPELFSDSKTVAEPLLTRPVFEYHLESLTNRKEEIEFEHFCRKLAEKEICPNLKPQTGPTGGGDSKVDAETFPVSDAKSLRWYEGVGREPSQERWAFAFSAKKDWASKARLDVRGIASTDRDYKLIYFITNQFAPDKRRAKVEDELTKAHGIPVHILDRSWIVKSIFDNERVQLAIEALSLTGYEERTKKVAGPIDTGREGRLIELDAQIEDPSRYVGVKYQLAEDCLQTALLARGLGKPRTEIDGRFKRAESVAQEVGDRQQQLRVAYQWAWTSFWWYDDFSELNRLYDEVEKFAVGSLQVSDVELLVNLWQCLNSANTQAYLDSATLQIPVKTDVLKSELDRLAAATDQPTSALRARFYRLTVELNDAYRQRNSAKLEWILNDYKNVLGSAENLVNFPVEQLTNLIKEMGTLFVENITYDELFEIVIDLLNRRASEGAAGQSLLGRGIQKLEGGRRYDAIRYFGRAQQKLALEEYRDEHISALAGCALAYESAGLLWAARANMLVATSQSLVEFWENGTVTLQSYRYIMKLVWLELQLGRVPSVLAFLENADCLASALNLSDEQKKSYIEERENLDVILGLLLLKTNFEQLQALNFLPTVLENMGLHMSHVALLYSLGYEDLLREKGWVPSEEGESTLRDFFWKWRNQPADEDIPERPEFFIGKNVVLRSTVLGCEVSAIADNNLISVRLGEAILGKLEAFLATSLDSRMAPYRSEFRLKISPSELIKELPEARIVEEEGESWIDIHHPQTILHSTLKQREELSGRLFEIVALIMSHITVVDDVSSHFEHLAREEGVFGRMFGFAEISICIWNILGSDPKLSLENWNTEEEVTDLKRALPWDHGLGLPQSAKKSTTATPKFGEGEPPDNILNVESMKHREQRILSLIDIPQWNKAKWRATMYILVPYSLPVLGLAFENEDAAKAIFSGWRKQLGQIDKDDRLRIAIITGVDKANPLDYTVVVGENFSQIDVATKYSGRIITVSRLNRMSPSTSKNLDMFKAVLDREKRYLLAPAHMVDHSIQPTIFFDLGIEKRELHIRPAWQITENDTDALAIGPDDDPIIPEGVEDPPVLKAMEQLAKYRRPKS